jgi:hypothetical protein
MYEYKFIKVELRKGVYVIRKPKEDYHEIIKENAIEGWRFVQIFAPSTLSGGISEYFELIFEKLKNN